MNEICDLNKKIETFFQCLLDSRKFTLAQWYAGTISTENFQILVIKKLVKNTFNLFLSTFQSVKMCEFKVVLYSEWSCEGLNMELFAASRRQKNRKAWLVKRPLREMVSKPSSGRECSDRCNDILALHWACSIFIAHGGKHSVVQESTSSRYNVFLTVVIFQLPYCISTVTLWVQWP